MYRQRRQRTGIKIIALVGYTNAGKSSLLNAISKARVLAKDELFSTLDPTTRRILLPDNTMVLMTDTVGFIRKLPPTIVAAFRATLEELSDADLLVHVVDLTSHNAAEQCQTVESILGDLDLLQKPRITALNKIDLLIENNSSMTEEESLKYITGLDAATQCVANENTIFISAAKKWGITKLLGMAADTLKQIKKQLPVDYLPDH